MTVIRLEGNINFLWDVYFGRRTEIIRFRDINFSEWAIAGTNRGRAVNRVTEITRTLHKIIRYEWNDDNDVIDTLGQSASIYFKAQVFAKSVITIKQYNIFRERS